MTLHYKCRMCEATFTLATEEGFSRETSLAYAANETPHTCGPDQTGRADLIGCKSEPRPAPASKPAKKPGKTA